MATATRKATGKKRGRKPTKKIIKLARFIDKKVAAVKSKLGMTK